MSDNNNPYAAPSANLEQPASADAVTLLPSPRTVSIGRGWGWLAEGFGYFKRSPVGWILGLVVGFLIVMVLNFIPLIGPLIYTLILYVLVGGIMLGCQEQSRGGQFQLGHLFEGFKNPTKLVILSVVATLLSIVVMVAVMGPIYFQLISMDPNDAESVAAAGDMFADPKAFILQGLIIMALFIPITMAIWFAPALIAIHDVPVIKSLKMSFVGCLKNMLPFLVFGIVALVLIFIGTIPLGLGLLVVMPMITAGSYVAYRDIYTES